MKVGNNGVYTLKMISRVNKNVGVPNEGLYIAGGHTSRLQRAHSCCTHRNDSTSTRACFSYRRTHDLTQLDKFTVHHMSFDVFFSHWLERTRADMQGHGYSSDPKGVDLCQ